ncbi:CHASE3 domain-containing protein [Deinococcus sp.]|uniref:sensor histidine kinase n=1 Tax=Deinococcus sp. TaxID=47478 RepID=UPI0025F365F2|nr:CHASE3 domain-containing protein [Deinococcus sp.]
MRPRPASPRPRSLTAFLLLPLAPPLVLLLLVIASVVWGINRNAAQVELLNGAQVRLNQINLLARDIIDMETGVRGFIIVGDALYLEPYRRGQQGFRQRLSALERLSVSDEQRRNLQEVRRLVERWNREVATPEIRARSVSRDVATALVENTQGKQLIDEVRGVLSVLERSETLRREAAVTASASALRLSRTLTIAGLLGALLLLILIAVNAARTLMRGLDTLGQGAQRVALGQYGEPLPDAAVSEVQALRSHISVMAESVQAREAGLIAARDELEASNRALEASNSALEASNSALARSNQELEQFAYVASHDLQEPLRTIGSYTELLGRRYSGQLDERADTYIAFTLAATHRLRTLIQDLLLYSRLRQPGRPVEPVDVQALVQGLLDDFQVLIAHTQASIQVAELPVVPGNAELLRHVFQNLIGNALKFRDPQRPLTIQITAVQITAVQDTVQVQNTVQAWPPGAPPGWTFSVIDNGIGIEEAYFGRIFGVFQRLHGVGVYEGSGIGLALVRSVVERLGGAVRVNSVMGQGSTFTFTLPSVAPEPPARFDPPEGTPV